MMLAIFSILTAFAFLTNVCTGYTFINPVQIVQAITGNSDEGVSSVIFNYRIPVALAAVVSGLALAIGGVAIQAISNNPLASPYTFGIASAAAFGAALLYSLDISLIPLLKISGYAAMMNAFIFALIACLGVLLLSKARGLTAVGMILAGICISFFFQALLAFMQYLATQEALQAIVFWIFGSLYKATTENVLIVTVTGMGSFLLLLSYGWKLTAIQLGDEVAQGMGVNVRRLRIIVLVVAALTTAVVVSSYGVIPFICIASPHIAKSFVGEDVRYLLPCSGLVGATILSMACVVSKIVHKGAIMPIGIVTSLVGIPILLRVLIGERQ